MGCTLNVSKSRQYAGAGPGFIVRGRVKLTILFLISDKPHEMKAKMSQREDGREGGSPCVLTG